LICSPGKGQDWRLHARYDPDRGRFADLVLTTTREAEAARRTRVSAGRVHVMDRGYARARDFQAVLRGGGDFITRTSWRSVKLFDAGQRQLDLISRLEGVDWPHAELVWVEGIARPLRLLIRPLPPEAAERQRARRIRRANHRCQTIDPRTIQAAGFLMLLTSLPADRHASEQVFDAYRDRWQIEIGFKRLKTLGRLDELPSSDPVLARTWLLAQLIAAVLTDDLANEIAGFSP
jgi:IS4 transposase